MAYLAIIGVGRGGIRTVNNMYRKGMEEGSFLVCDTDEVILMKSPVENKILMNYKKKGTGFLRDEFLSDDTTRDIKCRFSGLGIIFFIASMGGKTGRDLLPEIIGYCRDLEIRVSCFVTYPFTFEGNKRSKIAEKSIYNLRQCADSVVVLNNDIIQETDSELDLANAFHKSHLMLAENCEVFYNILYKPSYISLTLEDYYSTLRNSTVTIIASGYSAGEKRVLTAFDEAVKSPLFKPYKIDEMDGIICAFQCSTKHQIQMEEVEYIHEIMRTRIKEGSNFIWLADFNEEMNEEVKVTLIASIKNNK